MKFHLGLYAILPNSTIRQVYAWFYSCSSDWKKIHVCQIVERLSANRSRGISQSNLAKWRKQMRPLISSNAKEILSTRKTRESTFLHETIKQILRILREQFRRESNFAVFITLGEPIFARAYKWVTFDGLIACQKAA